MEIARFDRYYQRRPPLDRMLVRFILNTNTTVANALAGAVDVLTPPTIDTDAAFELRRRWEGTGNTVRIEPVSRFVYGELQFRPEFARPANAVFNRTVREALYRALNRAGYAEVMSLGLASTANRFSGRNRGGYQNARVDEILDELHIAVDPRAQIALRREHVQQLMGDVALMPAYWEVQPVVLARGVKADISPTNAGWNVF